MNHQDIMSNHLHGDHYDGINSVPQERTDTTTQFILDWDAKSEANPYMTIEEVINEWEHDLQHQQDLTCRELGDLLYEKFQFEWNDGYKRGRRFLQLNDINYGIINAIEDLYIMEEYNHGGYLNKNCLEDKLDIIYYFKAEKALKAKQDEHEVWGIDWEE